MLLRVFKSECALLKCSFTTATKQTQAISARITCKIQKFNVNQGERLTTGKSKFGSIELASQGWNHNKSKGDYFTIHPRTMPVNQYDCNDANKSVSIAIDDSMKTFDKLGLSSSIVTNLHRNLSLTNCTYIQYEGIPQILAGDHTIIAAETGCGKTLTYLLPILEQILARKNKRNTSGRLVFNTPLALVLTPSRELGNIFF